MRREDLFSVMESVTARDLTELASIKGRLVVLERKRASLEKELAAVVQEIETIRKSVAKRWSKRSKASLKTGEAKGAGAGRGKRVAQPALASLIVEVLKQKKKALGINQLCDAVLKEKQYQTDSKNFKGQLRVLVYKNEKGLFKKTAPGLFTLA